MNRNFIKILSVAGILSFVFLTISALALKNAIAQNPDPVLVFDNQPLPIAWNWSSDGVTVTTKDSGKKGTENYEYAEKIQALELEGVAADWRIEFSEGASLKVVANGKLSKKAKTLLELSKNEGTLKILADKEARNLDVRIQVPKEGLQAISLKSVSGNAEIQKLKIDSLTFNAVSGDLGLTAANAKNISFETVSGNLEVEDSAIEKLTAQSISGDFQGNVSADFSGSWTSVSGDFELKLKNKPNMEFSLKTVSGTIENTLAPVAGAKHVLKVETTSGDVEIE